MVVNMKITKLGQKGVYSIGRYLYSGIKSTEEKGAILLLPESFVGNADSLRGCVKNIYYNKGQKFSENCVYMELESLERAKKIFNELGVSVAVAKDLSNKEIYVFESM